MPRYDLTAISALMLSAAACMSDSAAPTISLIGTWDLIAFTDGGVAATTTGTWTFAADSSFTVAGTVTFPGEPTDSLVIAGTYVQHGSSVQLTIGAETGAWTVTGHSGEIVLTEIEPPPANTISLRRPLANLSLAPFPDDLARALESPAATSAPHSAAIR